jgi:DNA-binding PadR family transcriptional regulator
MGPGPEGPGGFGFGRPGGPGARFRHGGGPAGRRRRGDVRTALLLLLSTDGPLNGYQLMQKLDERSEGRWRPSPGSVYPALAQLEDEGLIRVADGHSEGESGRAFEVTDRGREHIATRGDQPAPWEPQQGEDAQPRVAVRNGVISIGRAAWQVVQDGTPAQVEEVARILEDTRRHIYRLLAGDA